MSGPSSRKSFHHADAQGEPGCWQRRFGTHTPQTLGFQGRCRGRTPIVTVPHQNLKQEVKRGSSLLFSIEKTTPNDHKDGWPSFEDVDTNLVRGFGRSYRRRPEILPCEEPRQGRCEGLQSVLHQAHFRLGIFWQLWDRPSSTRSSNSTTLWRGERSSHQVGKLGEGTRHSLSKRVAHDLRAIFSLQLCSDGWPPHIAVTLGADLWRSNRTALPRRGNEGL